MACRGAQPRARPWARAALQNCGFDFPVRRITVNLAPADLPKESGRFDLQITLGILTASGQIPAEALLHREFAMACGAAVRAGLSHRWTVQPCVISIRAYPKSICPWLASAAEAVLVPGIDVFGAADLPALCAHLSGSVDGRLTPIRGAAPDSPLRRRAPLP